MSLQFYLGGSGYGKSYKLHKDISEWAKKEPDTNFLFLVPDQYTMQTQMDLVKASGCNGIMNIDVLSFSRLAHRVFEELGCKDALVLDDTGKSLILRHIAEELADSLPVLGANMNRIGYIHEIKSVISEFKTYSVDEEKIDEMIAFAEGKGLLKGKLKDLKNIYAAFNDYTRDEFITSEETMTLLSQVADRSKVIKDAVVVFDGFTGFTPIQYRLIQRLLELTKRVIVSVTVDTDENPYGKISEQELFGLSKKTIKKLQAIAQEINVPEEDPVMLNNACRYKNSPEMAFLEKNLFRYNNAAYSEESIKDLFITEGSNPDDEVRRVCMDIRELTSKQGYEYRDIAVVCGDLGSYEDSFLKYSKKFDIPYYIDETKGLRFNPFVEYIRSALLIVKENYSYSAVFHFLRSGMSDISEEAIDIFDNYIIKYGIRGKSRYAKAFTAIMDGKRGDKTVTEEDIKLLQRINETRAAIFDLLEEISFKNGTAGKFVEALYSFIVKSDIERKLTEMADYYDSIGDYDRSGEYKQIYRMVIDLLDQIHGLLKDAPMDLDEFIKILDSGIEELTIRTIPKGMDRVIVGDIERTRVGEVKVLFLLGANDGNIPRSNAKGGLISDIDREFLKESDIELSPTPREQIFIQRLYLYLSMSKPSEKLYVSYSMLGNDGKTLRQSYIVPMLLRLFPELKIRKTNDIYYDLKNAKSVENGIDLLGRYINEVAIGGANDEVEAEISALFAALSDEVNGDVLEKLIKGAFYEYKESTLSKDLAEYIYGEVIKLSVSRLERYASCAYKHFLTYGMELKEREEYGFEVRDLGNIYHDLMEQMEKSLKEKGYSLSDFPEELADEILDEITENESVLYGGAILRSTNANVQMISQIKRIIKRTLVTVKEQLNCGKYLVEDTEMPFNEEVKLDDKHSIILRGRIDRVDTYEANGKLYVKIVDYKSSKKEIELDSLLYGLSLQQPVYMKAAMEKMMRKYPLFETEMAAMLYYRIDDPLVDEKDSADDIQKDIVSKLRPEGLVNSNREIVESLDEKLSEARASSYAIPVSTKKDGDYSKSSKIISGEDYEVVSDFTMKKIADMGSEILAGNIGITPVVHRDRDACTYCEFKGICPYDDRLRGFSKKQLKSKTNPEAIEEMKEWI